MANWSFAACAITSWALIFTVVRAEGPLPKSPSAARTLHGPEVVKELAELSDTTCCHCGGLICGAGTGNVLRRWYHCHAKPRLQASHWGYKEFFHERPFGTFTRACAQIQVLNGLEDQMVLYRYDFLDGPDETATQLSPRGKQQLRKFSEMMERCGLPITIEKDGDAALDESRRHRILQQLRQWDMAASGEQVVVKRVPTVGIGGPGEQDYPTQRPGSNMMYQNRLLQTLQQGGLHLAPAAGRRRTGR
jgi:hypothetical protein